MRDEDCDGLFDCADPDCVADPSCTVCAPAETVCADMRDEDCDGLFDCADRDCAVDPRCLLSMDAGVDAGPLDAGVDAAMCMRTARVETSVALCTNGSDDDCDTAVDCADTECTPFGAGTECCNGLDDDGDGNVDLFTCACTTDAQCAGVGSFEQVCWSMIAGVCGPRCNFAGGDAFCRMVDASLRCDAVSGQCVPR
jgi:hypothetical protein